ncbi:chloramphenicol efflux pump [Actinosynnema sp. ALI-1.44]|uniref:Cmx/CmrA family chloramphenicol efflux MFS transporter n=1 Tax=Actinosynnema sp. ALI-1.44 TaxID=1933779 RepID=UPI00097CB95D|nr:Cmx/CmrA family chloramphenicol efflux MFS transporter [Actinosynnema sp. ALI-1.44]ONI84264.1 chloramphenicol efflux pump [Actinosynnema sp. ALI-1.44]
MPFAVHVLGLAVFAQGTSEFMLSGLVHDIAGDLRVSIPAVGSLTPAFAVGMIVGAPLVALLSLRWPRRGALLAFLATFFAVHVIGAVTTSFEVLFATRVIAALANAGFLAVGLATAASLAGPRGKGRATSVLLSGITLACIAGVPLGAVLSGFWGWRSAFWAVAAVSVPALFAILRAVPATPADPAAPSARHELRALRTPRLIVTLVLGALVNGATFCTFTYLAPVITGATGLGSGWVPAVLALFGIGSFVGVTVGGLADAHPMPLLAVGTSALLVGWLAFVLLAAQPVAALVLVVVQGMLSFGVGSTLITQALYAATDAPTLAGGFATAAFNVGAAAGPALGGVAFTVGLGGNRAPLVVSAILVAAALVLGATAYAISRTRATKGPRAPRLG